MQNLGGAPEISHEFHELARKGEDELVKFVQFVAKKRNAVYQNGNY
jgi:hypothetical protein